MRRIQLSIMFSTDDDVTDEQIQLLVDHAMVQIEDPRDDDGGDPGFTTANTNAEWEDYS